jgi:cytochrome c556
MNKSGFFHPLISMVSLATLVMGGASLAAAENTKASALADVISVRQQSFKEMGTAMKVFRKELRSDSPDRAAMTVAADMVARHAGDVSDWFPVGSGPESGLETDALPYIWKNTDKFSRLSREISRASVALVTAVATNDTSVIISQVSVTGKTCKGCHDSFRAD